MERRTWKYSFVPVFASLSFTVGLGDVWRFPYVCDQHGGYVFLVPYLCVLLMVYPLLLLFMVPAQYCSRSTVVLSGYIAPIASGLGWGVLLVELVTLVYYQLPLAWLLHYTGSVLLRGLLLRPVLPWNTCDNAFNSRDCIPSAECSNVNISSCALTNATGVLSVREFFDHMVTVPPGQLQLGLVVCLLLTWLGQLCFLAHDVFEASRLLYAIVGTPLIMLVMLVVSVKRCPPPVEALDWSHVIDPDAWLDAVRHALFTFGLSFAAVSCIASHNCRTRNICRDTAVIVVVDTTVSFMSYEVTRQALRCTAAHSPPGVAASVLDYDNLELAFIAYPLALSFVGRQGWSAVFFLMLYLLGVGSYAFNVLSLLINLKDRWPVLHKWPKLLLLLVGLLLMLAGLPLCSSAGKDLLGLFEEAATGPITVLLVLLQAVAIVHCVGPERLFSIMTEDLCLWVPTPFRLYLRATWIVITPCTLFVMFGYSLQSWHWNSAAAKAWDLGINTAILVIVLLITAHAYYTSDGTAEQLLSPTDRFAPHVHLALRAVQVGYPPPAPAAQPEPPPVAADSPHCVVFRLDLATSYSSPELDTRGPPARRRASM